MTVSELAVRIANGAYSELEIEPWGPSYEMDVEFIGDIIRQGQSTTNQQEFLRWCTCVRDAAMHMAQDGQRPFGPRWLC